MMLARPTFSKSRLHPENARGGWVVESDFEISRENFMRRWRTTSHENVGLHSIAL